MLQEQHQGGGKGGGAKPPAPVPAPKVVDAQQKADDGRRRDAARSDVMRQQDTILTSAKGDAAPSTKKKYLSGAA